MRQLMKTTAGPAMALLLFVGLYLTAGLCLTGAEKKEAEEYQENEFRAWCESALRRVGVLEPRIENALKQKGIALHKYARNLAMEKVQADEEKTLAAALKKATLDGKYQMLLRQIKVPDDKDNYNDPHDYGIFEGTSYGGFDDLPKGYWTYVSPYWYIWREKKEDVEAKRAWGPEQATGEPDTTEAGDIQTAWASQTPDGQDEWLMLEYAEPVLVKEIHVHETYNPGAVTRATAFKLDGSEVEVWRGKDPSEGKDIGMSVLPVKANFKTARIKLYIESPKVAGWNEIDAVGLKDGQGKMRWAVTAAASSTFAQREERVPQPDRRIQQLEREVKELREKIKKLEELLEKKDK